jgi:hypothetical protein
MFVPLAPAAQTSAGPQATLPGAGVWRHAFEYGEYISPPQPNEAMARIAPPFFNAATTANNKILLVPSYLHE